MSEAATAASERDQQIEYLAKKLHIPREEADVLLDSMQDTAGGDDE